MKFSFPVEWYNAAADLEDSASTPGAGHLARHTHLENIFPSGITLEQTSRIAFSQFIELSRRKEKLSIEELAARTHVKIEDIVKIENKDFSYIPTMSTIGLLAKFFEVSTDKLAEFAGLFKLRHPGMHASAVAFIATSASTNPLNSAESKSLEKMYSLLACNEGLKHELKKH